MTDETHAPVDSPASPTRSIALTTPILTLSAGLIAVAAFLLGYVVHDIGHRDGPRVGHVMVERGGPMMGGPMMDGAGGPDGKRLDIANAGTFDSVSGNTMTLKTPGAIRQVA